MAFVKNENVVSKRNNLTSNIHYIIQRSFFNE